MDHNEIKLAIDGIEGQDDDQEVSNYSQRGQWLRAAVLGANDGLLSTVSLMMGVEAVKDDAKAMIISGLAGLVAGACSMATAEFVSVYSLYDIEVAQMKREKQAKGDHNGESIDEGNRDRLPSLVKAAVASALAFSAGAMVPLLAAGFIRSYEVRLVSVVVAAAASAALVVLGCLGAALGRAPVGRSCVRVVVGGWVAMAMTFGLMKLFGSRNL
ncbi:vacuolar iron transporter homolog 2-like [Phoenix dactylifera]|uniref:Vacuolar iron transporter n=1 Tax=Phoenix dactylifera TaxID=42345 RepID=A0A8B9AKQ8_PHODC|nr:vacuolar iron transporter homolog 2-like [Phoenix dactylifera]